MKKLIFTFILATLCGFSAFAYDFSSVCSSGGTLGYNITSSTAPYTVSLVKVLSIGSSSDNNIEIPESVAYNGVTYSVTSIGSSAFSWIHDQFSVTIPNSVTTICETAFDYCIGLTSVYYIGDIAGWCGISFGNERSNPLYYAQNLYIDNSLVTDLVIPNTVTEIKNYAFYGTSCLTSLTIGNSVTSIGDAAFAYCSGLTSVTIPNSVTSIGQNAFCSCSGLTSATIGSGVTSIGQNAFSGCSGLTRTNYTGNIAQWCGIRFDNQSAQPLSYAHNLYINSSLVTNLVIPNTVEEIKAYAFYNANSLTSVTIPNSVTSIGNEAFYNCSGLTGTLTIPNSVTSIGNYAFSGCNGLTTLNFNAENCTGTISGSLFDSNNTLSKITIGENVATIPNNAFKNCISLDSIISYASNPPVIYSSTFDSQLSLNTPVVVPCGTVANYEEADFWYNFRRIRQAPGCGQTYTINVLSNNSSWGTVSGGGIYVDGTTATLTATPNEGCTFSNWSDGSTENPHDVVVMADATYIATFVQGGSSNPTVYNSIEATACGSYTWNNQTYTESGEYQQTFTAANSADSIVTLTLTILPTPQPTITLYGELDACNPSSVAFATEQYQSYQWSNGATTMITSTSVPGYYYVEVTGENGCTGISEQVCIGVSNAITEAPQISVVGMNSENRNVVAWSALDNANVNAYRIYRENNIANVYEPMATVEASAQTYWTDETADPSSRAYRYKVTAVDECGGESPMSDYHKTMHLTINQGLGSTWNLIWSHYEGFNFGTYRIYRGTSPSNMTMIGEVPSNLNSYTDNTATDNTGFYYQVEVVRNSRSRDAEISSRSNIVDNGIFPEYTITVMSANPNRGTVTGGGTYPEGTVVRIEATALEGFVFSSWSDDNTDNPRYITVTENATYIASFDPATGIEESAVSGIALFPNPATDILNITSSETISEIEIVNTLGQVVKRIEINSDNAACEVEDLKAGVYVVRIHGTNTESVVSQQKFIKE